MTSTHDFLVKIAQNSGGTITLNSSPFDVREYELRAAPRDRDVVDNRLEMRLMDGSVADNLDEMRTLNNLLRSAYERNQKKDMRIDPVYVTWQQSTGGTVWRSEIVDAKGDWMTDALDYPYWTGETQFADLELTRRNYWEGSEFQIPLTNPNGTNNTSGLTVYGVNDGSGGNRYNYVEIAGTAVAGDLPGNTRLEIINTYASDRLAYVWIGQNWNNPSSFDHWLEVEESTYTGGTATASAAASGGTAIVRNIADDLETTVANWTLSAAYMNAAEGGYFKAILRYYLAGNTAIRWRLKILYNVTELWSTDLITQDTSVATLVRDLVTFQLPPWIPGLTSLAAMNLVLTAYHNSGAAEGIGIDAVGIIPVDGWRALRYIGYGTAQNSRIVDDGIDSRLYEDDGSGASKIGIYVGYGQPIQLKPAANQRLYFMLHSNVINTAEVARTIRVKLYYRPKRLTL